MRSGGYSLVSMVYYDYFGIFQYFDINGYDWWSIKPTARSSKVIDFGTNRKRICDFLLVRHSNLHPILHRFEDIEGF